MVDMDIKLNTWKNKLLDMGKRNRLLNYRDTRRSNLRIKVPGIYDLWDSFVVNESPLVFPFVDEEDQLTLEEVTGEANIKAEDRANKSAYERAAAYSSQPS